LGTFLRPFGGFFELKRGVFLVSFLTGKMQFYGKNVIFGKKGVFLAVFDIKGVFKGLGSRWRNTKQNMNEIRKP
jgi:hypothetical protein